jgi:hypothetical protein
MHPSDGASSSGASKSLDHANTNFVRPVPGGVMGRRSSRRARAPALRCTAISRETLGNRRGAIRVSFACHVGGRRDFSQT